MYPAPLTRAKQTQWNGIFAYFCFAVVASSSPLPPKFIKHSNRMLNIADTIRFTARNTDNGLPTCNFRETRSRVMNSMTEGLYIPDVKTFTSAMLNCRDAQHDEVALEIFDFSVNNSQQDPRQDAKIFLCAKPDRIMYGIAIACTMTVYTDSHRAEQLFAACDDAFKLGKSSTHIEEDAAVFAAMIIACDRFGEREKLLDYYMKMKTIPTMRPSPGVINSALRAAAKTEKWAMFSKIESSLAIFGRTLKPDSDRHDDDECDDHDDAKVPLIRIPSINECSSALKSSRSGDDVSMAIYKVSSRSSGSDADRASLIVQLTALLSNRTLVDNAKLRRRVNRLITDLKEGNLIVDQSAIQPTLQLYCTLIEAAGLRKDGRRAFAYFHDLIAKTSRLTPDRQIYRNLIEACNQDSNHPELVETARELLQKATGSLKLEDSGGLIPEAGYFDNRANSVVLIRNGQGLQSAATRKLIAAVKLRSDYRIDITALPEKGQRIASVESAKDLLRLHCEKQALTASLVSNKDFPSLITVNLCLCADCHAYFKAVSAAFSRKLICRDPSILHVFEEGACSCNEHWGGR